MPGETSSEATDDRLPPGVSQSRVDKAREQALNSLQTAKDELQSLWDLLWGSESAAAEYAIAAVGQAMQAIEAGIPD
jgi:hypothetical protein